MLGTPAISPASTRSQPAVGPSPHDGHTSSGGASAAVVDHGLGLREQPVVRHIVHKNNIPLPLFNLAELSQPHGTASFVDIIVRATKCGSRAAQPESMMARLEVVRSASMTALTILSFSPLIMLPNPMYKGAFPPFKNATNSCGHIITMMYEMHSRAGYVLKEGSSLVFVSDGGSNNQ